MSKIFIVGREPVATSRSEAIRVKEMWEASKLEKGKEYLLPKVIDVGNASFEGKDIRGFEITNDSPVFEASEYDLNDPAQKDRVKTFEKEFVQYCETNKGKFQAGEIFNYFLQEKEAVKIYGKYFEFAVIDEKKYKELKKLFSSLNTLRVLREKAASYNDPDFEGSRVKKFKEIKKSLFGWVPEIKNELEKIADDAKKFDEQNGMGEIDPKTIPF